ncbi:MAG: hypothetical protein WA821_17420 [Anaerolineales bacterium]
MNIQLFKRNAGLFKLIGIFAVLTLTLIACQNPAPLALRGQDPTPSTPSEPPITPQESAPVHTALPAPTAVPATLTPDIPGTITAEVPATNTPQTSSSLQIRELRMIDAKIGWAEDTQQRILRTTQGGRSWENVSPPYPKGDFDTAAFFFDGSTAVLVTTQMILSTNEAKAQIVPWRTADGGKTWKAGETVSIENAGPPISPVQFYFLNKQHGWLLTEKFQSMGQCEADILETRDGGFHYDPIYRTFTGPSNQPGALFGTCLLPFGKGIMAFPSDSSGFATDAYEQLVVSQDGGRTWQPLDLAQPGDYPHTASPVSLIAAPSFSSAKEGVLPVRVYDENQRTGTFYAYFHGLPLAQYLYYTHDGGRTWLPRPAPARIGMASFLNPRLGWFLGKDDPTPSAGTQLYLTSDGGETWSLIAPDSPLPLGTEIQFIDGQNGFAYNPYTGYGSSPGIDANPYHELDSRSGSESYLFTSKDGGRSWSPVEPQPGP